MSKIHQRGVHCRRLIGLLLMLIIPTATLQASIPETALRDYIHNGDDSFAWQVIDSTRAADVTGYRLLLTSQTWRGIRWMHEMVVVVPDKLKHSEALLHLTGGGEDEQTGEIKYHDWNDATIQTVGQIAHGCRAVTAVVWQVPRQPLFGGMREDVLVSYTYHKFQETGDPTWPLLFPMTKTAIRAMDAVQQMVASRRKKGRRVTHFVVNGVSKRGWTTWLTAASGDPRVKAIAPMVIDILNMPVNLAYQKVMYGRYSEQIMDYVNLGLTEDVSTEKGRDLLKMVDPYSYRKRLTLPKMLIMGSNDEFWTADAVKHYIDSIPGTNAMTYVPNAGHSLGDKQAAVLSLEAFFAQTLAGGRYTTCRSSVSLKGKTADIFVQTQGRGRLLNVELWEATSETLDFRKARFAPVAELRTKEKAFHIDVQLPDDDYKAFFVMLTYRHPVNQQPFTICTRMYTADAERVRL
ncbi:MAG: PhoPQ-activated pathogenicity-related family protein [Bacteroidaceae bacterium]|nr:PhoPQ-activated pathogenicity-related family protein [Bacteroidaceae bacterium]